MKSLPLNRYVLFFVIAALGCAADLLSKYWVFQWRGMTGARPVWWIWEGYFGIETTTNPGGLFGMGGGTFLGVDGAIWFAGLSLLAGVGVLIWLFVAGAARDLLLTVALACVTAGIVGNLYDRLGLWAPPGQPEVRINEVRDWILFCYFDSQNERHEWPNFNLADCLLVSGAGLLLWHAYVQERRASAARKAIPQGANDMR